MNDIDPGSDPVYKRLYSFPEMVADLLRSVLPAAALEEMDLRSLDKAPADYVGDDFRKRHGDTVWRVRAAGADGGWAYVLVLLEFQASSDATMALRILEYTAMLYRELLRAKAAEAGRLPPVLPVVLYNGESRWTAARDARELVAPTGPALAAFQPSQRYLLLDERHAEADYAGELTRAVALLEQSRSPVDLAQAARLLADLLGGPDREELRRAFADWLWVLCRRMRGEDESAVVPPELTLEEVQMTLEERVARWPEQWIRQGIEQERVRSLAREHARGLARLRRQAAIRFGATTAERLSDLLGTAVAERMEGLEDQVSEWMVECSRGEELLSRVSALVGNGGTEH